MKLVTLRRLIATEKAVRISYYTIQIGLALLFAKEHGMLALFS